MLNAIIPSLLFIFTQNPADAPKALPSAIRNVTVYPSEALVTRTAKGAVERGQTRISIQDLPQMIRDDSVRVRAAGGATVVGVDIVPSQRAESASATVEELRKQRSGKQHERDINSDLLKAQDSLQKFIEALRAEAPKAIGQSLTNGSSPAATPASIFGFVSDNLPKVLVEMRRLTDRDAQLAAEIADLDQRLSQLQSGKVIPTKNVFVDLVANGTANVDIEISYMIPNAGWAPSYDVRAADNLKSANLLMYGVVTQFTGEDWSQVNLILSTAKPERGAQAPVPQSQYLTIYSPQLSRGLATGAAPAPGSKVTLREHAKAEVAYDAAAPAESPAPLAVDANIISSGLSTQFVVPRAEDVPADGRPHRVRVADVSLTLDPIHVATPKLASRAFVQAKPKNTSAFPILMGEAQVFVGNDFVGRSRLPEVPIGELIELSLGSDPGITIERIKEKADREAPGFLGSRVKWTFTYRINVKNTGAATGAANVEIVEAIPVSRDDRVKVEINKSEPAFLRGEKEDKDRETNGFLKWRLALAPGESKSITISYIVTVPEDLQILGLEK